VARTPGTLRCRAVAERVVPVPTHEALGIDGTPRSTPGWLDHGHMGGGDQVIGLNRPVETGRPGTGELIVTVSTGIGLTWTVAVLEVPGPPRWG
jgi:3-oxoacyl-[acyl-carrier-protein] synthase III